jgi:hypothetical protein
MTPNPKRRCLLEILTSTYESKGAGYPAPFDSFTNYLLSDQNHLPSLGKTAGF